MTKIGKTALVVVDVQQGFLDESWGPTTNHPGCEINVERLLQAWAERDLPVVVVRHDSGKPDSPLHPTHPGNALIAPVAGAPADLLVTKSVNSAFYGTPDLEAWLRAAGIDQIVVCGIQTNMCVGPLPGWAATSASMLSYPSTRPEPSTSRGRTARSCRPLP